MRRIARTCIGGLQISILICSVVLSQGSTAQITGTVRDQSGAVLPGVEITATQTSTGVSRMTLSDETGFYTLPNLPIGPYRLEAVLPGFRTYARTGIALEVNSSPQINVVMARRRWGRRYCRTRYRDFTIDSARQASNHVRGFLMPILRKLVKLRESGHVGHAVEKDFPDQMINFVLNAHGIEAGRFKIHDLALPIECFDAH